MFIGHFAPAIAAARLPKAPSLPILLIAGQLVDWVFFGLLLTKTELMRIQPGYTRMNDMDLFHMPYTHSLLGTLVFAGLFGGVVLLVTRRLAAGVIAGAVVTSHWVLDLIVHRDDLTLIGAPPKLGFGLWDYPAIEMPLEIALVVGALLFFARGPRISKGKVIGFALVLFALQAVNWFGPQPTQVDMIQSVLAWFAFGVATLAGWWMVRKSTPTFKLDGLH
jgi:hypothetical protein